MAASAQLLLSALSKQVPEPSTPSLPDFPDLPEYADLCTTSSMELPLTSEPPLSDAAPLTSEPPLADVTPLTSEPTAYGTAAGL
ncbi:hypothetical protein [Streptomyces beijiangensis]|uniref:Uncharacterized protein n=1 Tax=Streptomyces beijiangensis TaxID=163361 RepID=A0A939F421_9ACTN|nr:hypothetical protein [Streptomyces beijiangensis]MBO0511513.1 hypothetical protein [Streptomyces beijiangensis]